MARLNTRASTADTLYRDRTPTGNRDSPRESPSPTPPSASFSSDKENRGSSRTSTTSKRPLGQAQPIMSNGGKRRRLEDQRASTNAQRRRQEEDEQDEAEDEDKKYYDPNQNPEERRAVRMGMREVAKELVDRTDEFMKKDNSELVNLIQRQNSLMGRVKQTSDATMDSRFLLNASEITLRKSRLLAFGDSALGVDIDEFVAKCASFMRNGRALGTDDDDDFTPTQAQRNRRNRGRDDSDGEEEDHGDAMNWDVLGEKACFPNNKRPTAPCFLLGPLSVEKRVRTTQRRATQRRDPQVAASRPQELREADLEKNEASNLTSQCKAIRDLLHNVIKAGEQGVDTDATEDMDEDDARDLFRKNNLAMNWQVPLLKFALNPNSFGQTVENLFYISFLVKDGFVKVEVDEDSGFPTIRPVEPKTADDARATGDKRHQAIFSLDYRSWQIFKSTMRIREPLIPHRQEEQAPVNGRGWYG